MKKSSEKFCRNISPAVIGDTSYAVRFIVFTSMTVYQYAITLLYWYDGLPA